MIYPRPRYCALHAICGDPGVFLIATDLENIIELLGPREVVGQAINVLIAHHDVGRDAAFEMLVHRSCGARRKVRDIAAEVVQQNDLEPP